MPDITDSTTLERVRNSLRTSAEDSHLVSFMSAGLTLVRRTTSQLSEYTRESFLYRWLTKEPDPGVIVIDLRETYTAAPLIRFLDYLLVRVDAFNDWIGPYWYGSRLNWCFDESIGLLASAVDTTAGRTLRAILEPPDPPADDENRDD